MKREETTIFCERELELPELSNLQLEVEQKDRPLNRKELLSILIRSELELAYIFATDVLKCTHLLKKIIRKPLKKQKRAQKTRKTSFASEAQSSDFPTFLKSANWVENTNF